MPIEPLADTIEHNHEQTAEMNNSRNLELYKRFNDAQFQAIIQSKSVKMNAYGDWECTITIPRSDEAAFHQMTSVVGMPINVRVEKVKYGE